MQYAAKQECRSKGVNEQDRRFEKAEAHKSEQHDRNIFYRVALNANGALHRIIIAVTEIDLLRGADPPDIQFQDHHQQAEQADVEGGGGDGSHGRVLVKPRDTNVLRPMRQRPSGYHAPIFGALAQGSFGACGLPFWSSSTEMPSGERMKVMRPSRGGREMVTPRSAKRWVAA